MSCTENTDDYHYIDGCYECDCALEGTVNVTDAACAANATGRQCDRCIDGYYGYPNCKKCECDELGTVDTKRGQCDGFTGACNNYFDYLTEYDGFIVLDVAKGGGQAPLLDSTPHLPRQQTRLLRRQVVLLDPVG